MDDSDEAQMIADSEAAKLSPEAIELVRTALAENRLKDAELLSDRLILTHPKNLEARLLRGELPYMTMNGSRMRAVLPDQADVLFFVRDVTPLQSA